MAEVTVKIINKSNNELPAYATLGAAGMDIRANLPADVVLQSGERKAIPTGLFVEIPEGYEIQIRPRSGLALKQGITCLNTPGTIDSDYRGEICVILINLDQGPQRITHGERIAQLVLNKVECMQWQVVEQLNLSSRSEGGFGHTGKH